MNRLFDFAASVLLLITSIWLVGAFVMVTAPIAFIAWALAR